MSMDLSGEITAIATSALAALAIATAVFAFLAFRAQSREVRAIERQVADQQEVTRQQAELLRVQSGQLGLQREQLAEQHTAIEDQLQANARQAEVLKLQASELKESLSERKREAEQRRSAQATQVFISQRQASASSMEEADAEGQFSVEMWPDEIRAEVTVVNASNQPIYGAELRWHRGSAGHGDPNPEPLGTVMPGSESVHCRDFPEDTNMVIGGAVLRFRDAAGTTWMRRLDGGLVQQQ
jgi:hypothetical protein